MVIPPNAEAYSSWMINKNKTMKKKLSEEQIDENVISQADNDSEWV
jgi:hypothetical protein